MGLYYQIIEITNQFLEIVKISGHITEASYFRILLAEILPFEISKILYLDVDLIIKKDLGKLWDYDISEYSHFAVENLGFDQSHNLNLLMTTKSIYFNAGVMFINLDWWRKNAVFESATMFLLNFPDRIIWHDQDVLNAILDEKWLKIPYLFNAQESIYRRDMNTYKQKEYLEAYYNPKIIHFTGGGEHSKPWYNACKNELRNEYVYYAYKLDKSVKEKYFIWFAGKKFNLNDVTINFVFIQRFIRKIKYLNFKFSHFLT